MRTENRLQTEAWFEIRKIVLERDGHKCRICKSTENLGIHHIVPFSKCHADDVNNLLTACSECHKTLENKTLRFGETHYIRRLIEENKNALASKKV